jgi:hypothetical protein
MGCAMQEIADFLVRRLREIDIPLPDGGEALWRTGADDFVGQFRKLSTSLRRTDGYRDDDPRWPFGAHRFNSSFHRGARRQAIVDQNDDATAQIGWRPGVAIRALTPLKLSLFFARDVFNRSLGSPVPGHDVIVQHSDTARRDGAHGQFGMAGKAQLSDQEHIEWRIECSSYFVPDRNTPAWECQHDDITAASELVEVRRKLSTGIASIAVGLSLTMERRHVDSSR